MCRVITLKTLALSQRWGGWDAPDSQIIGSRSSRRRGCRVLVFVHDQLNRLGANRLDWIQQRRLWTETCLPGRLRQRSPLQLLEGMVGRKSARTCHGNREYPAAIRIGLAFSLGTVCQAWVEAILGKALANWRSPCLTRRRYQFRWRRSWQTHRIQWHCPRRPQQPILSSSQQKR